MARRLEWLVRWVMERCKGRLVRQARWWIVTRLWTRALVLGCALLACACSGTTASSLGALVGDINGGLDAALSDAPTGADTEALADQVGADAQTADAAADVAAVDVATVDSAAEIAPSDAAAPADTSIVDVAPVADVQPSVDVAADVAKPDAGGAVPDPNVTGPYGYAEFDDTAKIASTGDSVAVHCAYPIGGGAAGPYPVIVLAHGFQLAPDKYYGYVRRLASFGYVAMTVDFPTSFISNDNPKEAKDLAGALDWAAQKGGVLTGKVDADNAGVMGHSLGGKLAFLAATLEPRFKAVLGLDPVDGGGPLGCNLPQCVDVSVAVAKLAIPSAFVGETTDAAGGMQPCAPSANNFQTFYASVPSKSVAVTVNGANHMSFLDDTNGCMTCGFCNKATAAQATVTDLSRSYAVAFFERNLRGLTAYDDYLTGATAQARYVATGIASIQSK